MPAAYAVLSNPNDRTEYDATLPTRDALVEFYSTYNPAKLDNSTIQTIINSWHGREVELFEMLNAKYEVAPHQGTSKGTQRAAANLISRDKAREIAMDSQTCKVKEAEDTEIKRAGTIGSAFCCKGMFSRLLRTTYYEVDTTSPGFMAAHGESDTPGQAVSLNLESPVTPLGTLSPASPVFRLPVDTDNLSSVTTADGSPPSVDGDYCTRITEEYRMSPLGPRAAPSSIATTR